MSEKLLYDEFSKLPPKEMAKAISEMTYAHKHTVVTPKHYEKLLVSPLSEVTDYDRTYDMQMHIIKCYEFIKSMKKEDVRGLVIALIMNFDANITPNTMTNVQYDALCEAYKLFDSAKPKISLLNDAIIERYKEIEANGVETVDLDNDGNIELS